MLFSISGGCGRCRFSLRFVTPECQCQSTQGQGFGHKRHTCFAVRMQNGIVSKKENLAISAEHCWTQQSHFQKLNWKKQWKEYKWCLCEAIHCVISNSRKLETIQMVHLQMEKHATLKREKDTYILIWNYLWDIF